MPDGAEVVYSTAVPLDNVEVAAADRRLHRGELLAEIVASRRAIVVGGTHGKTTTASMIAFCLQELGQDPAFVLGTEVPQLGGNASAGEGWLVTEGDEADRSIELLRPAIAVLTNVDFDHHVAFASLTEVEEFFERWVAGAGEVVRGDELEPVDFELGRARRAQPPERGRCVGGARAGRGLARRRRPAYSRVRGRRPPVRAPR